VWNALTYHAPMLLGVELIRRIPSLYPKVALRPLYAGLNVTDNCNMRCIMCNSWRSHSADELTTDEWKGVIRQLRDAGVRYAGFAGGEPLLRKDLAALIAHAARLGLHTEVTTSGYLLDEARAQAYLEAGLKSVVLSLDGVGAEYEAIRGREWARVERACELLARANRDGALQVVIGFVLMKPTLDHVAAVKALGERLGLPIVVSLLDASTYLFQLEQNTQEFWIRSAEDKRRLAAVQRELVRSREAGGTVRDDYTAIEWFGKYFEDPRQPALPCAVSQTRILIDSHGMVFGGCWAMGSYGCLRRQPLREILSSDAYRDAHRKMFFKECPGCSCGYKVSLKLSLPTQLRELGLRLSKRMREKAFAGDA
jgi:MoaA/NifB/PqqE/SkfB family radical SAM enzyme